MRYLTRFMTGQVFCLVKSLKNYIYFPFMQYHLADYFCISQKAHWSISAPSHLTSINQLKCLISAQLLLSYDCNDVTVLTVSDSNLVLFVLQRKGYLKWAFQTLKMTYDGLNAKDCDGESEAVNLNLERLVVHRPVSGRDRPRTNLIMSKAWLFYKIN